MTCVKCGARIPEGVSECPACAKEAAEQLALGRELDELLNFDSAETEPQPVESGTLDELDTLDVLDELNLLDELDTTAEAAPAAAVSAAAPAKTGSRASSSAAGKKKASTTAASANGKKKKKKKKKRGTSGILIVLIFALVAAIVVFGGIGLFAMKYTNYDTILPNVYVVGVPVGGMTMEEATVAVTEALSGSDSISIDVVLPDQTLNFAPEKSTVDIDVEKAVVEAYNYGRTSANPFTLARAVRAAERTRNDIDISQAVSLDSDYVYSMAISAMDEVSQDVTEGSVTADEAAHTITATLGTSGKVLDANALAEALCNAFSSGNYSDIEMDYVEFKPQSLSLNDAYDQLTVEPTDATYDAKTEKVSEGTNGWLPEVSLEDAELQLAEAAEGETLTFAFKEATPEITASALKAALLRDTLYTAEFENEWSNPRANMALACEKLDGIELQPGDKFSFFKTVGEPTEEDGYVSAAVRPGDADTAELGGGLSVVATALYQCCLYSDLTVTERHAHTLIPGFTDPGLDAYVSYDSEDFCFTNSSDYPIRIEAEVDEETEKLIVSFIGTNLSGTKVKLEVKEKLADPYEDTTITGDGTDVEGVDGGTYTLTRKLTDKKGQVLREDTVSDLDRMAGCGTSVYDRRDAVTYVAPEQTSSSSQYVPYYYPTAAPAPSPSVAPTTSPSGGGESGGSGGGESGGSGGGESGGSGGGESGGSGGGESGGSSGGGESGGSSGGGESGGGAVTVPDVVPVS